MATVALIIFLVAPGLLALAALLYAMTHASDRVQLATLALFLASLSYWAQAYELYKAEAGHTALAFGLGAYALIVYAVMAALAIYYNRTAWRLSVVIFAFHIAAAVLAAPVAAERGATGYAALLAYLVVGAGGLWATLHRGTRTLVLSGKGEA